MLGWYIIAGCHRFQAWALSIGNSKFRSNFFTDLDPYLTYPFKIFDLLWWRWPSGRVVEWTFETIYYSPRSIFGHYISSTKHCCDESRRKMRYVPKTTYPWSMYQLQSCAWGKVEVAVLHSPAIDDQQQVWDYAGGFTMLRVISPSGSISLVPRMAARTFPPFIARSWQYTLIFSSPPSHLRNSSAGHHHEYRYSVVGQRTKGG